jgi:hypothetical protein
MTIVQERKKAPLKISKSSRKLTIRYKKKKKRRSKKMRLR